MDFKYCKLEIFIPETHLPALQKTLREVDAGHIGNYDSCMSSSEVTGYWRVRLKAAILILEMKERSAKNRK